MGVKTPVMLLVLVQTAQLRWFVASLSLDGEAVALLRSDVEELAKYRTLSFDEQVAFLRHRFCGVLQHGCDRLWTRNAKACQFVFVFEGLFPDATGRLTQALAEHLAQWMLNPPVVAFHRTKEPIGLEKLAGQIEQPSEDVVSAHLDALLATRANADAWELVRRKGS